jgi:hypothetical protein
MGWAFDYLSEIREEVLLEIEEQQSLHKKGVESLEVMLRKYE